VVESDSSRNQYVNKTYGEDCTGDAWEIDDFDYEYIDGFSEAHAYDPDDAATELKADNAEYTAKFEANQQELEAVHELETILRDGGLEQKAILELETMSYDQLKAKVLRALGSTTEKQLAKKDRLSFAHRLLRPLKISHLL